MFLKKIAVFLLGCLSITHNTFANNFSISPAIDATLQAGNRRHLAQAATFIPLYQGYDGLVFTDVRFMRHLPHTKKSALGLKNYKTHELNLGAGYRFLFNGESVMGVTGYFDRRVTPTSGNAAFKQITLNTHFLTPTWQTNFNLYVPFGVRSFSKSRTTFNGKARARGVNVDFIQNKIVVTENSLVGADLRISTVLPGLEKLRVGTLLYSFKGNKSVKGVTGGGMTGNYVINQNFTLETSFIYDKVRKFSVLGGIRFTLPLDQEKAANYSNIEKLFATRIERDIDIVTNNKNESSLIYEQQPHIKIINNRLFKNINDPSSAAINLDGVSNLDKVLSNPKGEIIVHNDGDEFDYNTATKVKTSSLAEMLNHYEADSTAKLRNNQKLDQIHDNYTNLAPLERAIAIIATQHSNQRYTNQPGSYVLAGKSFTKDYASLVAALFNKYAKSASTSHRSFFVELPHYGMVEIERAGAILVTKLGNDAGIVLGTDAGSARRGNDPWNSWFSGSSEQKDANFQETVIREAFEESAGTLALTQQDVDNAIAQQRFFYSPHHKIFAILVPDNNNVAQTLNSSINRISNDTTISAAMKEMQNYYFVPRIEILHFTEFMAEAKRRGVAPGLHVVGNDFSGNNKRIRLERHYADSMENYISSRNPMLDSTIKLLP